MAREAQETVAQRIRRENEGTYDGYDIPRLKDEVIRLLKVRTDHKENKSAELKSYNSLIKDADEKITYCSERIDYINHEDGVASVLENER